MDHKINRYITKLTMFMNDLDINIDKKIYDNNEIIKRIKTTTI